jgi:ABC-type Fe3+/spermidine/putrescine transport system ATPase subunit
MEKRMMRENGAVLRIDHVSKQFHNTLAVDDVSLNVRTGELLALVGPSGCGKTTLLRMIAGLENPDTGRIALGGTQLFNTTPYLCVPTHQRQIGMVFQNYALWPHMTVAQNVAYPLRVRGAGKQEQHRAVISVLKQVRLAGYGRRYPHQLSSGEQQRAALARALVMRPRILLLDEPLSNLDAHLREDMGNELQRIQQETRITVIHVTHDQVEAMTLADRIVVMERGSVVQAGHPEEVYRQPRNRFVASFIGISNLLECPIAGSNGRTTALLPDGSRAAIERLQGQATETVTLSIRPEDIALSRNRRGVLGKILDIAYQGNIVHYRLSVGGADFRVQAASGSHFKVGDEVRLRIRRATVVPEA